MLFLVIGSIVCLGAASEHNEYNEYSSYPPQQYGSYPASNKHTADEYTVYSSDPSQQYDSHLASNKKSSYKSDMNSHSYDQQEHEYDNYGYDNYGHDKHGYDKNGYDKNGYGRDNKYEYETDDTHMYKADYQTHPKDKVGHTHDKEHYGCHLGSLNCQCNKHGPKCDKNLFCNHKTYRCEDTLYAKLGAYPGYKEGAGYISGEVTVTAIVSEKKYVDHHDHYGTQGPKLCDNNATTLVIKWNLKGQSKYMDPAYMGGLQIDDGNTCSYSNQVGGPFWCGYSDPKSNPWQAVHWSSNRGTVNVQVGLSLSEVVGRTLVITRDDGHKLACGVLKPPATKTHYYP